MKREEGNQERSLPEESSKGTSRGGRRDGDQDLDTTATI
jgi:hypothetical protein